MATDRIAILTHLAQTVPPLPGRTLLRQGPHSGARFCVQEDAVGPDEFEGVPFDGIVARGENQPTAGMMMLDGHLHRRGRHDPELDGIDSDRHESG